jgi:cell division septation protein DedD
MMSEHVRRSRSPLSSLKPFLLVGLVVVIGLLVGLGTLLRTSDTAPQDGVVTDRTAINGADGEDQPLVPGAITVGPAPNTTFAPGAAGAAAAPVTPSEFTFYETLKKPPQDPAATVGLAPAPKSTPASKSAPSPAPAAKVPRVIETAAAQTPAARYTVQVAAFRQQPIADRLIADLTRKGHDAYLVTTQLPDGTTYRVRVGKFATREEAARAAKRLAAEEKVSPFVATVGPNS